MIDSPPHSLQTDVTDAGFNDVDVNDDLLRASILLISLDDLTKYCLRQTKIIMIGITTTAI